MTQLAPDQLLLGQTLGQYKPGQLGAAPTLGNEAAQRDYATEMAQALMQAQQSQQRADAGSSMMTPEYAKNSGLLGSLAMMGQAYAGRKTRDSNEQKSLAASGRYAKVRGESEAAKEARDAAREEAKTQARIDAARRGDPAELAALGISLPTQNGDLKSDRSGRLFNIINGVANPVRMGNQAPRNTPAADASFDMLRDAVEWQESRGNPGAVSPAGARGRMQTMPGTLRDPGYGVAPARDSSDGEMTRVGNEYLQAMTAKYGTEGGLAAYNWGPGNWEKALERAGGDPQRALASAPKETRDYVPSVLQRAQGSLQERYVDTASGSFDGQFQVAPDKRDAPSGFQWAPDGESLVPIKGGPADRKANPTAADQATGEGVIRRELNGLNRNHRIVLDQYSKLQEVANGGAANDLALIFSYMKMLDPGSVVREQEFANAQNAAGVPDQVRNVFNKIQRGERLNPTQRAEFLASARAIAGTSLDQNTAAIRNYQGIADEYGYDPARATGAPDFRNVQGSPASPNPSTPAKGWSIRLKGGQ